MLTITNNACRFFERDKEQVTLEEYKTEGVNKEVESEKT